MNDWNLPPKPKIRIGRVTAGFMVSVALIFDSLQLVPKVFYLLASAGSLLVGWIPFVGQATALGMVGAAIVIDYVFSLMVTLCGYLTMWLWFHMRGVALGIVDKYLFRRLLIFGICLIVEFIPFINILPTLAISTIATILMVWEDDRQRRLEWEGKLTQFEKIAWTFGTMDVRRTRAFLHDVKSGRVSHAKLRREVQVMKQKMTLANRKRYENHDSSIKPVNEA